jgi:DHA1 family inner membrane transport protein
VLFALGNAGCALARSLPLLLAARVLMGAGAVFVPVAAGLAVALSEPSRRGQALSLVFLGMSLSYVVGVPLGAWLGLNHGWRTPIWLASAASLAAALAVAAWVPRTLQVPGASFAGLGAVLRRIDVLGVLGITLAYFAAIFCVFAYIGPVFNALVPMNAATRSLTLLLFGVGGACGTLLGGWATDRFGAAASLRVLMAAFALALALVPLTEGRYPAMVSTFMGWGVAGFGMMAPQQSRLAGASPAQAPLLLSLNSSMMYFGMALGAAVGGAVLPLVGFARLSWVGLPLALAAYALLWATTHRRPGG